MATDTWLAKSWRPVLMYVFGVLIAARWLGFVNPDLSEQEIQSLWDVVKIAMGGYVVGRSAEKIIPAVLEAKK